MTTRITVTTGDGGLVERNAQQQAANRQGAVVRNNANKATAAGTERRRVDRIATGRNPTTGDPLIPPPSATTLARLGSASTPGIPRLNQQIGASRIGTQLPLLWQLGPAPVTLTRAVGIGKFYKTDNVEYFLTYAFPADDSRVVSSLETHNGAFVLYSGLVSRSDSRNLSITQFAPGSFVFNPAYYPDNEVKKLTFESDMFITSIAPNSEFYNYFASVSARLRDQQTITEFFVQVGNSTTQSGPELIIGRINLTQLPVGVTILAVRPLPVMYSGWFQLKLTVEKGKLSASVNNSAPLVVEYTSVNTLRLVNVNTEVSWAGSDNDLPADVSRVIGTGRTNVRYRP